MSHTIVENGVTYTAKIVNGKTVYDPPLPKEIVERNAKRLRDMLKSRSAPRCLTDVEFFGDVGTLSKQYGRALSRTQISKSWPEKIRSARKRRFHESTLGSRMVSPMRISSVLTRA